MLLYPLCVGCEDPEELVNGSAQFRGTAFGIVVTYSCDDGFELNGLSSIRCLEAGLWSGSVPTCDCTSPHIAS